MKAIRANPTLQATAAAPLAYDAKGDSLLPGFVVAHAPAAAPELIRYPNSRDPSNTIIEPTAGGLKL